MLCKPENVSVLRNFDHTLTCGLLALDRLFRKSISLRCALTSQEYFLQFTSGSIHKWSHQDQNIEEGLIFSVGLPNPVCHNESEET